MNSEERSALLEILKNNENRLMTSIDKSSETVFLWKPSPTAWSMAEIVEHIGNTEAGLLQSIQQKGENIRDTIPATFPEDKIIRTITNRSRKVQAPEFLIPTGRFKSKAEAMAGFKKIRLQVENFVKTTDLPLEKIAFNHFILGLIDAKGWIVFMAGHCERHILQMEENKAAFNEKEVD